VAPGHRKGRTRKRKELKDRLIQTRVPQGLESTLKEEAEKRRLSVSHLIRNVLEDAFHLVDNVVASAGRIAEDSVDLAGKVAEDAGRIAKTVRDVADEVRAKVEPEVDQSSLRSRAAAHRRPVPEDVLGWQALVIHRPSSCFSCGRDLERGATAHLAFTAAPQPPLWLCPECFEKESEPV